MTPEIKAELLAVISDWKAGRGVRALQIGHSSDADQKKMLELTFRIIQAELLNPSEEFQEFQLFAEEQAHELKLTGEEQAAAISLAWIALRRGWKGAIHGHAEQKYISLAPEANA